MWNKARPFERKKNLHIQPLLQSKNTIQRCETTCLFWPIGTSPGSLSSPGTVRAGTVRPVVRHTVQPPSTRAWGVSVGWVEWWICIALDGENDVRSMPTVSRFSMKTRTRGKMGKMAWNRGKFDIFDATKIVDGYNLGVEFWWNFPGFAEKQIAAMREFGGILTTCTQVIIHVEDKFMKVEILDSMFKNCSSKQGTCCTAGKSCKGVDLQIVKCTVSESFSQSKEIDSFTGSKWLMMSRLSWNFYSISSRNRCLECVR